MIDERATRALAAYADEVRPRPDPYGRALMRRRRSRNRRVMAAGLSLAAVAAAGGLLAVRPQLGTPPADRQTEGDRAFDRANAWAGRLVHGPTEGAVGADRAFVSDLAERVRANQESGRYGGEARSIRDITVPFVDDVGDLRVALVVFVLTGPDRTGWPYATGWLTAPAGADPAELAATALIGDGIAPFLQVQFASAMVGVAPEGCEVSTAALPAATDWQPEPNPRVVVRTRETARAEWWRVSCDGRVQQEEPAPYNSMLYDRRLDESQLAAALAGARGPVAPDTARADLDPALGAMLGFETTAPRLLWGGPRTGIPIDGRPVDGTAYVLAAPLVRGGWVGTVVVRSSDPGGAWVGGSFVYSGDPTRPDAVAVAPVNPEGTCLVVPPTGTATVALIVNGRQVTSVAVVDGAAVLRIPPGLDARVDALDAAGAVIGSGTPATEGMRTGAINRWGD